MVEVEVGRLDVELHVLRGEVVRLLEGVKQGRVGEERTIKGECEGLVKKEEEVKERNMQGQSEVRVKKEEERE